MKYSPVEISVDALKLEALIYSGQSSEVWSGRYQHRDVAVKVNRVREVFLREYSYFEKLRGMKRLVPLIGYDKREKVLVMEWMPEGSLDVFLECGKKWDSLSDFSRYRLATSICQSVEELHQHGVAHGDIKPGNFLLDREGRARLCDLGYARLLDSKEDDSWLRGAGTAGYCAPEMLAAWLVNQETDVYGLGVTLWSLLSHQQPFNTLRSYSWPVGRSLTAAEKRAEDIRQATLEGEHPGTFPSGWHADIKHLIEACWSVAPRHRPSLAHCIEVMQQMTLRAFYFDEDMPPVVKHLQDVSKLSDYLLDHASDWIQKTDDPLDLIRKVDFLFECGIRYSLDFVADGVVSGPVLHSAAWKGRRVSARWTALVDEAKQAVLAFCREDPLAIPASAEWQVRAFLGTPRTGGVFGGTFFGSNTKSLTAFEALKAAAPPPVPRPLLM